MLFNTVYILLFLSVFLYAVFYLKKSFEIDLKYFILYLSFLFVFETIAVYLKRNGEPNLNIYNALTFFEFNFLMLFFKNVLELKKSKKNVVIILFIFNVIYFLSLFLEDYLGIYNTLAYMTGCVLITIVLFFFLKEFLNSDRILNYSNSLYFWITFGLLIYYLGSIPITSIINSINDSSGKVITYMYNIQSTLSILMYGCFIFGVLWSQKKVK
jgi:hypothetical protein